MLQFRAGVLQSGSSTLTDGNVTLMFNGPINTIQDFQGEYLIQTGRTLTAYSPAATGTGATARNGAMVNPSNAGQQGFDGRISGVGAGSQITYSDAYNIGLNLPYTPVDGDSLIVCISRNAASDLAGLGSNPVAISEYRVFTFVDTLPSANAIRPPWCGTWKPIYYTSDLQTGLLGVETGITDPTTHGPIVTATGSGFTYNFNDPEYLMDRFLDVQPGVVADPVASAPGAIVHTGLSASTQRFYYPRDWGRSISQQMLYTMGNYSQRNVIAAKLVKWGMDYMAGYMLGWSRAFTAGFVGSRKSVAMYAGKLLNNPVISGTSWLDRLAQSGNVADATRGYPFSDNTYIKWSEDATTYYTSSPYSGYAYPAAMPRSPTPSGWPGGYPLYGDNQGDGTSDNHSDRDPAGKYNGTGGLDFTGSGGLNFTGSRYQPTDNPDGVTGNQYFKKGGGYFYDSFRCMAPAILTNRMLGIESYYNNQALSDFFDWFMQDDTLAIPDGSNYPGVSINTFYKDVYRGGSGNSFVVDMYAAHG